MSIDVASNARIVYFVLVGHDAGLKMSFIVEEGWEGRGDKENGDLGVGVDILFIV